ncbi:GntR family transcriptional regulator [Streptomyces sp. NPDC047985]|uniref:GntR family transcriptional regulator n=1 Tax=Streptomyces sp. NPDC047985 TaxID=3155384 RepID=UPI00342E12E5
MPAAATPCPMTENALADDYGMSRPTVRRAIAVLTEEALVNAVSGRGNPAGLTKQTGAPPFAAWHVLRTHPAEFDRTLPTLRPGRRSNMLVPCGASARPSADLTRRRRQRASTGFEGPERRGARHLVALPCRGLVERG